MPNNILILKLTLAGKKSAWDWHSPPWHTSSNFISHNAFWSNSCHWKSYLNILLCFKGFNEKKQNPILCIDKISFYSQNTWKEQDSRRSYKRYCPTRRISICQNTTWITVQLIKLFCYKNKPSKLPLCHTGTLGIGHLIRQLESQVLFSNEEFKHYGEKGNLYRFLENSKTD